MRKFTSSIAIAGIYVSIYYFLKISHIQLLDLLTTIPIWILLILRKERKFWEGFLIGALGAFVAASIDLSLLKTSTIFRIALLGTSTGTLCLGKNLSMFIAPAFWAIFPLISGKGFWFFMINYLSTMLAIFIFKKEGIK